MSDQNPISDQQSDSAPAITPPEVAGKLEEKMAEVRLQEKEKEVQRMAANLQLPYINLFRFPISAETLTTIPQEIASQLKVICFLNTGPEIRLGIVNAPDERIQELVYQLEEKFHGHVALYLISEQSFQIAFRIYATIPKKRPIIKGVTITQEEIEKFQQEIKTREDLHQKIQGAAITDILSMVIAFALQANASDLHLETEEKGVAIRCRLDGVLHTIATLPLELWSRVVSRVKLIAGLKINITDQPQDGRFTIAWKKEKIDVRVSALPSVYGESIVIRIFMPIESFIFKELGLQGEALALMQRETERPNGMIIATGPTGCGKTTTLFAILQKLNTPAVKIITLEDPIEYKIKGITQSQVDYGKDYTFAKGLRSVLRQDPDIVMVGEIRDLETTEIAIQAALTGHLMLSTIHTNSAAGAIPRFLALGAKPFLLAPALNAVIGQRLVRKICPECKKETTLPAPLLERAEKIFETLPKDASPIKDFSEIKFYEGSGCPACHQIGYNGRLGIFEIMTMSPEIEKAVLSGQVSEYILQDIAVKKGMLTMLQDGLLKAISGITSIAEVFRVVD